MMELMTSAPSRKSLSQGAGGFSLLELIITLLIIAIVATFAVLGITRARDAVRLQNSARLFASSVEKARLDAIRRHATTNVDITGPSTYAITMDFDGTGATPLPQRSFQLEKGVVFTDSANTSYTVDASGNITNSTGEAIVWADFNWRGRTTMCSMLFRMQNSRNERTLVQVAGSGDITIDTVVETPAALTTANVNSSSDISTSAVIQGSAGHFELNPCATSGGAGGSIIVPPVITACGNFTPSTGLVAVRKNGATTATVNITVTSAMTLTATPNVNLSVSPTTKNLGSGGTATFSISSATRIRSSDPPFTVTFTNGCGGSATVYVKVTN